MALVHGESSSLGARDRLAPEEPSPLRIMKRRGESEGFVGNSRGNSWHSDESASCQSEEMQGRLTIMKRRSGRMSLATSLLPGSEDVDGQHSRYPSGGAASLNDSHKACEDSSFRLRPGFVGSQTLSVGKTRQPRPSLNSQLGLWAPYSRNMSTEGASKRRSRQLAGILGKRFASQEEAPVERDIAPKVQQCPPHRLPGPIEALPVPPPVESYEECGRYMLCPHVAVTTDVSAIHDGQQSIWAAVEVSGRLSKVPAGAPAAPNRHSGVITGSFIDFEQDRFFEFRCLYDLTVEVLPLPGAAIQRVLREQTFPTTICAGSSVLMLVQLHFDLGQTPPLFRQGHIRQKSEELMEDLEMQLGSSQLSYMQVRVTYAHSAFPDYCSSDGVNGATGISRIQSKMETKAVASLKRHNSLSPWSPRPAPAPNILFQLIERHWGPEKAQEAMQQILVQRSVARKPANTKSRLSVDVNLDDSHPAGVGQAIPMVPRRQASLHNDEEGSPRLLRRSDVTLTSSPKLNESSPSFGRSRIGDGDKTTAGQLSQGGNQAQSTQQAHQNRARHGHEAVWPSGGSGDRLCKRRSFGSEGLKGLMPKFPDTSSDGRRSRGSTSRPATVRLRGKKDAGRWAWASWF